MARTPRPYWGAPNYRKPKRTSSTFSRSRDSHSSKKYEDRDRYRDNRDRKYSRRIPDDGRERVKRCLNCEHFSSDLVNCNQCGLELREDAKIFLNPLDVRSVFKHVIDDVVNLGPDFLPMRIMTDVCPLLNSEQTCVSQSTAGMDNFSELEGTKGTSNKIKAPETEIENLNPKVLKAESIITISSDEESENDLNDSTRCNVDSGDNDTSTSSIKDEDASDLINQMQNATCPPNTNYFVKKCDRCQTYSFDLQNCETCGKKMSQRAGIILYESLTKRKLKSDRWRKAKYYVARQDKHKIPIPAQHCDMNLVDKIIAKRQGVKPDIAGKKKKKPKKGPNKSRISAQPVAGADVGVYEEGTNDCTAEPAHRKRPMSKRTAVGARNSPNIKRNFNRTLRSYCGKLFKKNEQD